MEAYLDNAATTQTFPEVCDIVKRVMMTDFGNPSSKHTKGMEAENYINEAKENIAATLKCQPKEIVFTSGGTESNNMALIGTVMANKRAGKHIITTRIEHASIHEPLAFLEEMGYEVTYLKVDRLGHIDLEELKEAIEMIAQNLKAAVDNGKDVAAREAMSQAQYIAGMGYLSVTRPRVFTEVLMIFREIWL